MKKIGKNSVVKIEDMTIKDIKETQLFENFGFTSKTFEMDLDSMNDIFYRVKSIIHSANVQQPVKDKKNKILDDQFELLKLKSEVKFIKEIGYETYWRLEQRNTNMKRLMEMDKKRLKQEFRAFKIRGIL